MNSDYQQIGKITVLAGAVLIAVGTVLFLVGKFGGGKLPGDLKFEGESWKLFFPIGTCIILSIVLTILMWLLNYFRRH